MVTEETFYQVQAVLDGRNTNLSVSLVRRNRNNPDFPLRRIVKCQKCGAAFTGAWSKGKSKRPYGYYFWHKRCKGSLSVRTETLEQATKDLLASITMKDKTKDLFVAFLRRKYFDRISTVQKRREQADDELKKLYDFRQALVEKNLSGIYSDEMFKEQNCLIEEKIYSAQMAKNDELIDKYNLEAIIGFIKEKLANLVQTYENSTLEEKRVLLSSIFSSGLLWDDNGYSNTQITQFYSAIIDLQKDGVRFGTLERTRTSGLRLRKPTFYPLNYEGN